MKALIIEGRGGGGGDRDHIKSAIHLGWSGAEVSFTHASSDALDVARDWRPHLVIVQASGPSSDWLATVRLVRNTCESVVFAVADRYNDSDLIEAVEAGADDFLSVPLNLPLFVARARAALRRVQGDWPQPTVVCGQLQIDPDRYEARLEGRGLSLTSTEFRLLLELTRKNESVVRKGPLCRSIWGNEGVAEDAILRKHIQNLRRKLSAPTGDVNIVTVAGVGYKLTSHTESVAVAR